MERTSGHDARDIAMMRRALDAARGCVATGDVPVGAVVSRDADVLAVAGNGRERLGDPTAHAEVLAIREAARVTGSWRLDGCTLTVTLEPCAMCAGAIVLSRVDRLVFGTADPKAGFAGSLGDLVRDPRLNHRVQLTAGVLGDECGEVLRAFFRRRRPAANAQPSDAPPA
jgi:tRNA(adenine34) deaminase